MKNFIGWLAGVGFFGALGATARYLNDLGKNDHKFHFGTWLMQTVVGVVVAVLTGLLCRHFEVSDELLFMTVGVAAISAREVMGLLPKVSTSAIDKLSDKIK